MQIIFQPAKNGEETAVYNKFYLHSSYNPTREAERFVNNINCKIEPELIIITEPCISYIIPLLKQRFKTSKICIIRYVPNFNNYNFGADFIINYYEHINDFENILLNDIGEQLLYNTLFLQWQPSSNAFPEIDKKIIKLIKKTMEIAKTLLITREFFEKKWLINSCNFIKYSKNLISLKKVIDIPIVIISSGPSLIDSLNIIKNNQNKIFIIALSSALKVCLNNNIIPDLCLTTDGGFWAGQHLKQLYRTHNNIPIAAPLESFINKSLLEKQKILPLTYKDGISYKIAKETKIDVLTAERNGTVSGTALVFALNYSNKDIFFCGLDLSTQKGFQHCQPNENELNNNFNDNKLQSLETRSCRSEFNTKSLNIYRDWFKKAKLNNRQVFRVIENNYKKNSLGEIIDINSSKFSKKLRNLENNEKENFFNKSNYEKKLNNIYKIILNLSKTDEWFDNLYPLSTTSIKHNNNPEIINRIKNEQIKLMNKIEKILNE